MPSNTVKLASSAIWSGVKLEHHQLPPLELQNVMTTDYTVSVQLSAPITIESSNGARFRARQFVPDDVCVFPMNVPLSARWNQVLEVIVVMLDPTFVSQAIPLAAGAPIELSLQLGRKDLFTRAVCLALYTEMQQGYPGGRLYGETVAAALAVHLLTHYSIAPRSVLPLLETGGSGSGTSTQRLSEILDYIQNHLDEEMSLSTLAALLNMSPHYFCHLFKRVMGLPPHQYVIQQRVERARLLLKRRDRSIADIALECGFGNQSHLTKQFKKLYGLTPKKYREDSRLPSL